MQTNEKLINCFIHFRVFHVGGAHPLQPSGSIKEYNSLHCEVYSKFSFGVDSKTLSDFFLPSTRQPVNASYTMISVTCIPNRLAASHQDGTHHIELSVSNLLVALIPF
jgi:hypothetical protein